MRRVFLLCLAATCAHAAKFALLVGINHYNAPGIRDLEGPAGDVRSLAALLTSAWRFEPANVTTLVDAEATRPRILDALDRYAATLHSGDFLFLYYSGHGTSWFAPGMPQTGISADTGALIPADLELIVGNRDLQPRLRRLDSVAQVFAVFDTCYSGNSIKTAAPAPARFVPPEFFRSAVALRSNAGQSPPAADSPYPYHQVLYLSAASKAEQAADIPHSLIEQGFHTIDGRPHGALTDALLAGLSGAADTNHDGALSYDELYQYVRQSVTRRFPQTPQLLFPPTAPHLIDSAVFSVASLSPATLAAPAASPPVPVAVKLEGAAADALGPQVSAIAGVAISESLYDLLVRAPADAFELYDRSGTLIQTYSRRGVPELLRRIAAEPDIRRLIDLAYPRQSFNVSLTPDPAGRGFYAVGERLRFRVRTGRDSYLLLLNIDVSGVVTVVAAPSAAATPAGIDQPLGPESLITRPTGMEYMKLIAFLEKPAGLDALLRESEGAFAPGTPPFARLLRILAEDSAARAAARWKLVTVE